MRLGLDVLLNALYNYGLQLEKSQALSSAEEITTNVSDQEERKCHENNIWCKNANSHLTMVTWEKTETNFSIGLKQNIKAAKAEKQSPGLLILIPLSTPVGLSYLNQMPQGKVKPWTAFHSEIH